MPHVGSSSAEDLASSDEIKVFEDEGEEEREKRASADLTDLKSSLITEGDQEKSSQAFSSKSSSQQSTSHHQNGQRAESTSNFGKAFESPLGYPPFSYPLPHSPYHPNGPLSQAMANKMAAAVGAQNSVSPLPFMMHNMEGFPQPPPAHMGISPVMRCKTEANINMNMNMNLWMDIEFPGLARNHLYNLPGHGQNFPSSPLLPDLTQLQQWQNQALYQAALRSNPYFQSSVTTPAFPGFGRTSLMPPHPSLSGHGFTHPSFLPSATSNNANSANSNLSNGLCNGSKSGSSRSGTTLNGSSNVNLLANGINGDCRIKQEHSPHSGSNRQMSANSPSANNQDTSNNNNNNNPSMSNKNRGNSDFSDSNGSSKLGKHSHSPGSRSQSSNGTDRDTQSKQLGHVKKPLNAFMIYMKEMRPKVMAESELKESAAINQILGKRWHSLSRAEQETYYDKARKERELHMEMHPGWTAKDNYAINAKRKKKKRERNADGERGALKKCRARFGLDQQNHWCKPCRRKKKCIRYLEALRAAREGGENRNDNDDNLGSVGSVDAPTPESKSTNESDHDNLNSTDLSLSSPPTSDYHNFMSSFNHFSSVPSLNSSPGAHLHLNGNSHLPSPSLFYPHHNSSSSLNSLNSPIGSRMSSLLTPNSPLTSMSNFSPSPLAHPIQAPLTPNPSHVPPRNSPFSIEQLARPHRDCLSSSNRSPSASISSKLLNSTSHGKNGSAMVSVITQLPTPPSSTDSSSATPTMLSVA